MKSFDKYLVESTIGKIQLDFSNLAENTKVSTAYFTIGEGVKKGYKQKVVDDLYDMIYDICDLQDVVDLIQWISRKMSPKVTVDFQWPSKKNTQNQLAEMTIHCPNVYDMDADIKIELKLDMDVKSIMSPELEKMFNRIK